MGLPGSLLNVQKRWRSGAGTTVSDRYLSTIYAHTIIYNFPPPPLPKNQTQPYLYLECSDSYFILTYPSCLRSYLKEPRHTKHCMAYLFICKPITGAIAMCQIGFKKKEKELEILFFTGSISVHKNNVLFFNRS